ncbi:hypothetical protein [Tautonia sociabilis]|uniref:Glycosyltransferase RgtA/B/C/D-like domain-containing protein n=1 Tax=Tautonia sociabilis TaxID=2080755 RepID=A0A432MKE3_9BACT|nr:hypothetical protein [Tautonia sociabilis]RUL87719.1 hypothetical protein TsocGM_11070 [Tautonia sociabilis]
MERTSEEGIRAGSDRPSARFRAARTEKRDGSPHANLWSSTAISRGLAIVAAAGVTLRLVRYLTDRPLWGDEAMIAVNVLGRGFAELAGPLAFFQVAPIGFLGMERAAVEWLGASTWSLRLAPTLCAVASVPLFCRVAQRAVGGLPALLAAAVFAVSFAPIRHGGEVKPYAFDLLAALVLLALALEWLRRPEPERSRSLWGLVLAAPIAMACSHPSAFVAGGIALALSPMVWTQARREPGRGTIRAWLVYLAMVPIAFSALYLLSTGAQSRAVGTTYRQGYWADEFPPLDNPIRLIGWLVATHAGAAFGYPIGGERGASLVSSALAMVGIATLLRKGRGGLVALLLAPIGLTLLAAFLGRYPYGGSARTMQHAAPALCLLIGVGGGALIDQVSDTRRRRLALRLAMAGLGLVGAVIAVGDLAMPYRTISDQRSRDFARWFWPEVSRGAEVGCARAMRGTTFDGYYWRIGRLELYLSYRALYLPDGRDPARPRLDLVSEDRPLRVVVYNDDPGEDAELSAWLDGLGRRFRLRDVREYPVNQGVFDSGMSREERFLVFEYVPAEAPGDEPTTPLTLGRRNSPGRGPSVASSGAR